MDNLEFHNKVGLKLERLTNERGKSVFTADEIDKGAFVDAMLSVLGVESKQLNQYAVFFGKCAEYQGKGKLEIPDNEAKVLFEVFEAIITK